MSDINIAFLLGLVTVLFYRIGKDGGDRFYVRISYFWAALFVLRVADIIVWRMQ